MLHDIQQILITEEQLKRRIAELAEFLTEEYHDKNPLFVGILKGVVVFYADMVRAVQIPCQFDFLAVSSYQGTTSSGQLSYQKDISFELKGRHVVILEDILDTGITLKSVVEHLAAMEPASLKICTLMDKPERRQADVQADYVGFTIPNQFVVGYGLDYNEQYRNLPFVGVLKPEVYGQ